MNFDELENAWAQQTTAGSAVTLPDLKQTEEIALARRGRLLSYEAAMLLLAVVVYPLLSVANFRYLHPALPVLFWANVFLHMALFGTLLTWNVWRGRQHRALARQRIATVREFAAVSVTALDAEIKGLRIGAWLVPLMCGLALISGYLNNASHYGPRILQTQLFVLAIIVAPVAWAAWRDYHVNLKPRRADMQALLDETR